MDFIKQEHIKKEETDSQLLQGSGNYIPPNFEPEEWNNLCDVLITHFCSS